MKNDTPELTAPLAAPTFRTGLPASTIIARIWPWPGVVISSAILIVAAPLLLALALGVKLSSPGPVVFRQKRVGQFGQPIDVFKFRSMRMNEDSDVKWSVSDDPRQTRLGSFMRRTSLDELPQLFSVLKGQMSLVGPRPEMPFIVDTYDEWQRRRLSVKPGITGLWQILGRKDLPMHENLQYDFYYIRNRSLGQDLAIMVRTVGAVFSRRGAF